MNRFELTAATQAELANKVHMIRAIGGSIEDDSYKTAHGAVTFKVLMTDGQMATFQLIRQIPNHEATFAAMHSIVTMLGGHIKDGSMTYLNGKMKPTIKLEPEQRGIYLMMQKIAVG